MRKAISLVAALVTLFGTPAFARDHLAPWVNSGSTQEAQACAGPGESVGGSSGIIACCAGLIRLAADTPDPAHCDAPTSITTGAWVCAPCGNGVCDGMWGEDRCNCPVDCETAPDY